jgi:hypothetical protein
MLKHGIVVATTVGDGDEYYWMGEEVTWHEFNRRLLAQTQALAKELDGIQIGMDLAEGLNSGKKTVIQMDVLEEILELPLCASCRKLIGEK